MGKKRKGEDLENERNLYASFVSAANSISTLYTSAQQQIKGSKTEGARVALERVAAWVGQEYGNAAAVPVPVLLQFLYNELEGVEGMEAQGPVQLPFSLPGMMFGGMQSPTMQEDTGDSNNHKRTAPFGVAAPSPAKRPVNHMHFHSGSEEAARQGWHQSMPAQQQHVQDMAHQQQAPFHGNDEMMHGN